MSSESEEVAILQAEVRRLTGKVIELLHRVDTGPGAFLLSVDGAGSMTPALTSPGYSTAIARPGDYLRRPRAPLPDPKLVQRIIRQRRLRDRYFEPELFADPAWDILLELAAARVERRRVSVTSLCIASAVPPTTALRWIAQMTAMGVVDRQEDEIDKRRAFIALSDSAADSMARYFDELGRDAARLV